MTHVPRETSQNLSPRQCACGQQAITGGHCRVCHARYMRNRRATQKLEDQRNQQALTRMASKHFAELAAKISGPGKPTPDPLTQADTGARAA